MLQFIQFYYPTIIKLDFNHRSKVLLEVLIVMVSNFENDSCLVRYCGKRWFRGHLKFYILVICLSGAVVFYLLYEEWTFLQCIYFAVLTGFTVGYTDRHPSDDGSRLFTILFVLMSLVFVFEAGNDFAKFVLGRIEREVLRRLVHTVEPGGTGTGVDYSAQSRTVVTRHKLQVAAILLLVLLCIGTAFFVQNEGWSLVTALYWVICTVSTVGYGDLALQQESSKVFLILFIPLSVTMFCTSFALLSAQYRQTRIDRHRDKLLLRPMDRFWMAHIVAEYSSLVPPEGVDKFAFVVGSLVDLGLVDLHDIDPLVKRFHELCNDKGFIYVSASHRARDGSRAEQGCEHGPYGSFKVEHSISILHSDEDPGIAAGPAGSEPRPGSVGSVTGPTSRYHSNIGAGLGAGSIQSTGGGGYGGGGCDQHTALLSAGDRR